MNPYLILGVARDADDAVIRKAYLEAIKEATPETQPARFKEIASAYAKIKNETSRHRYELFDTECPDDSPLGVFLRHARLAARSKPLSLEAMKELLRASSAS
jgi:curved DNA-binding protein CbpA